MGSHAPAPHPHPLDTTNTISDYARRYGVAKDPLFGDQRSGLSPIDDDPAKAKDLEALLYLIDAIRYQEYHLIGFRTKLIEQYNALSGQGALRSDLQAIHPMIDRDRWQTKLPRHLAFYPVMAPGKSGFWTVSNDEVWEIMVPILALATKLIDHFHLWQWWDTLAFGEREVLNSENIPKIPAGRPPLVRVVPRSAEVAAVNRDTVEKAREKAAQRVIFGISSSHSWPTHGVAKEASKSHVGISMRAWPGALNQFVVHLSFEELAPLMSSELSDGERLMQQLLVAKTLVHELAHGLGYTLFTSSGLREPYVADEPLIELGNSLINAIFGGNNMNEVTLNRKKWLHLRETHPMAVVFRKGWPTFSNVWLREMPDRPCLNPEITAINSKQYSFLLPLKWISDIQQEDYWDQQVSVYGAYAIRPEPLTVGTIETLRNNEMRSSSRSSLMNSDWTGPYGPHNGPFTEEEKLARLQRINFAEEIALTLRLVVDETYERKMAMKKDEKGKNIISSRDFVKSEDSYKITPGQGRPPKTYVKIVRLLLENRQKLALDTMIDWTPANLLLSYIHRLDQWQVPAVEFYGFLISCEAHKTYFEYDQAGNGQVRFRQGPAWPPFKRTKVQIEPPPKYDLFMYGVGRSKVHIHMCALEQKDNFLCDVDADHMYGYLLHLMKKITREYFDHAMAYCDFIDGYYRYGPEGIYRLNTAAPVPPLPGTEPPKAPGASSAGPSAMPSTAPLAGPSTTPLAGPSTAPPPPSTTESTPDPMEGMSDTETHSPSPQYYQHFAMERVIKRKAYRNGDSSDGWNSGDEAVPAFFRELKFPDSDEEMPQRKRQRRQKGAGRGVMDE